MSCTATRAPPVFVPGATVERRQWAQWDDDNEVGEGAPRHEPQVPSAVLTLPPPAGGGKEASL